MRLKANSPPGKESYVRHRSHRSRPGPCVRLRSRANHDGKSVEIPLVDLAITFVHGILLIMKTTYTDADLLEDLRSAVADAGSQSAWGRRYGFSRFYVCKVLAEAMPVTDRIATALGYTRPARPEGWRKQK